MLTITATPKMSPLVMRTRLDADMTDEEFFEFCQLNPELRIERTAEGEIIISIVVF